MGLHVRGYVWSCLIYFSRPNHLGCLWSILLSMSIMTDSLKWIIPWKWTIASYWRMPNWKLKGKKNQHSIRVVLLLYGKWCNEQFYCATFLCLFGVLLNYLGPNDHTLNLWTCYTLCVFSKLHLSLCVEDWWGHLGHAPTENTGVLFSGCYGKTVLFHHAFHYTMCCLH